MPLHWLFPLPGPLPQICPHFLSSLKPPSLWGLPDKPIASPSPVAVPATHRPEGRPLGFPRLSTKFGLLGGGVGLAPASCGIQTTEESHPFILVTCPAGGKGRPACICHPQLSRALGPQSHSDTFHILRELVAPDCLWTELWRPLVCSGVCRPLSSVPYCGVCPVSPAGLRVKSREFSLLKDAC